MRRNAGVWKTTIVAKLILINAVTDVSKAAFAFIVIALSCTNPSMVLRYKRVDLNHTLSLLELLPKHTAANRTSGVVGINGTAVPIAPKAKKSKPMIIYISFSGFAIGELPGLITGLQAGLTCPA